MERQTIPYHSQTFFPRNKVRIKLGKSWQNKLAQLPETGMGSQHVDFIFKNGRIIQNVPVFNGQECEVEQPFDPDEIKDVRLHQG